MKKLKLVQIEWHDSHIFPGGWQEITNYLDKKLRNPKMFSVGYVLDESKDCITLASSIDPAIGTALNVIIIPSGAIVKRKRIK